jgi:DNA-binding transcriptional regulator YiaG
VTAARPIRKGPYRDNLADLIAQMAHAGQNDPRIAARLEITPQQVRGIRKEYGIPAGERRWLPRRPPQGPAEGPTPHQT